MSTEAAENSTIEETSAIEAPSSETLEKKEEDKSVVTNNSKTKEQTEETEKKIEDETDSTNRTNKLDSKSEESLIKPTRDSKSEAEAKPNSEIKTKPKPKKRLTLQERLQLAAKKGSSAAEKKYKKRNISAKGVKRSPTSTPEASVSVSSTPRSSTSIERSLTRDNTLSILEGYAAMDKAQLLDIIAKNEQTIKQLRQESGKPEMKVESRDTNSELESLKKQIKEKDDKIEQIMEEGSQLSAKEVRLTQSLKKMKVREQNLENELEVSESNGKLFAMKAIKMEEDVSKLKDQLRKFNNNEKITRQLQSKADSLESQNKKLQEQLQTLKSNVSLLDRVRREKSELDTKFIKLKKEYDQFRSDKITEIRKLKDSIQKQKAKHQRSQEEAEREMKRLEAKLEEIRIENESQLSGSKLSKKQADAENLDSPSISMLNAQYTQAQENWKLLETSYEKKIGDAQNELEMYKKRVTENAKKIRALTNDLNSRTEEMNQQIETESTLTSELAQCRNELETTKSDLSSLKQRYDVLQRDYGTEKVEFEKKLKELSEEKTRLSETLRLRTDSLNDGQNGGNFTPSFYLDDFDSSTSVHTLNQPNRLGSLGNISVGESASTPGLDYSRTFMNSDSSADIRRGSRGQPLSFTPSQQHQMQPPSPLASGMSQNKGHPGITFIQHGNESTTTEHDEYKVDTIAPSESASNIGGSLVPPSVSNIQLVTKLSAKVRQLEREKISLRDENENLSKMKEDASNEILKLMKQFDEAGKKENEFSKLQAQIGETNKKYEQALESLGEKTERCNELQDDVADLKDMLKQQTLELVALHEKMDKK